MGEQMQKHGQFSIIPARTLYDTRLTADDRDVLNCLGLYADKNGWCFPKQKKIGIILKRSRSFISMRLKHLAECGYVLCIEQVDKETGSQIPSKYRILYDVELPTEFDRSIIDPVLNQADSKTGGDTDDDDDETGRVYKRARNKTRNVPLIAPEERPKDSGAKNAPPPPADEQVNSHSVTLPDGKVLDGQSDSRIPTRNDVAPDHRGDCGKIVETADAFQCHCDDAGCPYNAVAPAEATTEQGDDFSDIENAPTQPRVPRDAAKARREVAEILSDPQCGARPDVALSPQQAMISALADVCGVDLKLCNGKYAKAAQTLLKANYTAEQVRTLYGQGGEWYQHDWRGAKDELPNIASINETIKRAVSGEWKEEKRGKAMPFHQPSKIDLISDCLSKPLMRGGLFGGNRAND